MIVSSGLIISQPVKDLLASMWFFVCLRVMDLNTLLDQGDKLSCFRAQVSQPLTDARLDKNCLMVDNFPMFTAGLLASSEETFVGGCQGQEAGLDGLLV